MPLFYKPFRKLQMGYEFAMAGSDAGDGLLNLLIFKTSRSVFYETRSNESPVHCPRVTPPCCSTSLPLLWPVMVYPILWWPDLR